MLLVRMLDEQPELVAEARRGLGASETEVRAAHRHWQAFARARGRPPDLTRLEMALGPAADRNRRRVGDLSFTAHRWPLPLWPDLRFEALATDQGQVWQQWLVRHPGAPAPPLRIVEDLTPWSYVIADVEAAFTVRDRLDGAGPSRWAVRITGPDGNGEKRLVTARFVWGLLQTVVPDRPAAR